MLDKTKKVSANGDVARDSLTDAKRILAIERESHGRKVACTYKCYVADSPRFDTEFVIDRNSQMLPAANKAFGGLD